MIERNVVSLAPETYKNIKDKLNVLIEFYKLRMPFKVEVTTLVPEWTIHVVDSEGNFCRMLVEKSPSA